jgi:O-antigen/teichoic acid export membrane protein
MFRFCYLTARRFAPGPMLALMDRVERSPAGSRLSRGVFWSGVGAVVSRLLALGAAIIAARVLGKIAFGELGIIQSTLSMFATFAAFGVGEMATKHIAEFRKTDPERAGRVVAMSYALALLNGGVIGVVVLALAPQIAKHCLAAPHLAGIVALSSLALFFQVMNEAQNAALSGLEAFRRRSVLQAYGGIVAFPLSVVGVCYFGLPGAVVALGLAGGVLAAISARGIRKEAELAGIRIVWRGLRREMGMVWRFNLPVLLSGSVYVPCMWLANLLMVNGPDGYAQMGLFSAADRWRTAIGFLPALLGGVALPMLSSVSGESDSRRFQKLLRANVAICFALSLAVALPISALAPWIMRSYGAEFTEGRWVLIILCFTAIIQATYWIIVQSLVSKNRVWTLFWTNVGWAILLLGISWSLRMHGARGLAIAYLAADAFRLLVGLIICRGLLSGSGTVAAVSSSAATTS